MDLDLLLQSQGMRLGAATHELKAVNKIAEPYGLTLTFEQVQALADRRGEVLRETERIEFGRGILQDLVAAFASSPHLSQDAFEATLAELQDIFYKLKGESDEQVPDAELLDAMRFFFDNEAQGALELLEDISIPKLLAVVKKGRQDADEDWSDNDAYEEEADDLPEPVKDELDRVSEQDAWERPGNDYAATFYDGYREVYRITADANGRIGGSSLG